MAFIRFLLRALIPVVASALAAGAGRAAVSVVERGPHHNVVARMDDGPTLASGAPRVEGTWVQLEHGLNYWDPEANAWLPSRAEIELAAGGAVALRGQHRAIFSSNVNDPEGAVDLVLGDDVRLRSSVLGLRYHDPVTGQDAIMATVRDAAGRLVPPNQIVYRDAFDEVRADVVYTYRKHGLEADVVLRELPPSPAEYGLHPETTRIEVLTEFFEAPEPVKRERMLATVEDPALRAQVAEPDWVDSELLFGRHRIGPGRAFAWSARDVAQERHGESAPVGKQWVRMSDGRALLMESVEYLSLVDQLLQLPGRSLRVENLRRQAREWAGRSKDEIRLAALRRRAASAGPQVARRTGVGVLPTRRVAAEDIVEHSIQMAAQTPPSEPGLVLDWSTIIAGSTDFTFEANTTYHVTGDCFFDGTTIVEGGTVVKFPAYPGTLARVTILGPMECRTSHYRPAIFTSDFDNTVGETIERGVPVLTTDYGGTQLRFYDTGVPILLQHLRLRHGYSGILFEGNNPDNTVRHCQFVHCRYPVQNTSDSIVRLQNVLIDAVKSLGFAFSGAGTPFTGEHLTIHNVPNLQNGAILRLTNSFIVAVSAVQAYSGSGNHESSSAAGLFEAVGAGHFYLPPISPHRNAGLASISPTLAVELRELTTDAPVVLDENVSFDTTLVPRARRDTDAPDRGYHYAPLDYAVSEKSVSFATLRLRGGVALGVYGPAGIVLGAQGRLHSFGLPQALNRLVYYNLVQEQSTTAWVSPTGDLGLVELSGNTTAPYPEARFRFTEIAMPAGVVARRQLVRGLDAGGFVLAASHCRLRGVSLNCEGQNPGLSIALTNNLVEHGTVSVSQSNAAGFDPVSFTAFNNLFRGGTVTFNSARTDSPWTIRDNLFDSDSLSATFLNGDLSHNGFRAGLSAFGTSSRSGLLMDFAPAVVGPHAYPVTGGSSSLASLINAGSRGAVAAGLYHFTTRADHLAETNSTVDIGFHYPAPAPPVVGMAGYWRLDEGTGTQARDSSGNGLHGSLINGAGWAVAQVGNGVVFDGLDDQVTIPDSPALRLTNAMTIAFRIRKDGEATDWVRLIGKGAGSQRNFGIWDLPGASGRILFQFEDMGGATRELNSARELAPGRWYHVVCTWDGATGRIYVDGELDATGAMPGIPVTSSDPLVLGHGAPFGVLPGMLDDVVLYHRALSREEVLALHTGGAADPDADGLPTAVEDANGNGGQDAGETSFADLDTDYDGRSDAEEAIDGTDPLDPSSAKAVRLASWFFDNPQDPWRATTGALPLERSGVTLVGTSPPFVYGVEITNSGAVLRYRDVEPSGASHINTREGTVQITFSPYWASPASVCTSGNAGTGPGGPIELLAMGGFSIVIGPQGTNLMLRTPNGTGGYVTNVQAPFHACVGEFPPDFPLEIQVSYSTNASAIFYNRQLQARGSGIVAWPGPAARAHGLFIGSGTNRAGQVRGVVDSLVTYNVPLDLCTNAWILEATVASAPPSVTLRWEGVSNCFYRVERRTSPLNQWVRMASVPPPTWTDTTVVPGQVYDYRLTPDMRVPDEFFSRTDPAYVTVRCGIRVPEDDAPGHILLVVDRTLTNNAAFASSVNALIRDLWAERWIVARYDGPRHDDTTWANNPPRIAEVKSWITSYNNANPGQAKAVLLLGHVAVPYSGILSPDGHSHRPLPADCYYGDIDGMWTDSTNWPGPPTVGAPNVAGDGIFDQELIPPNASGIAEVELAVGRVDLANLPEFAGGTPPRGEVDLLVQYINKARWFRRRQVSLPERVVYDAYFSANPIQEAADSLGRNLGKLARRIENAVGGPGSGVAVEADFFTAKIPAVWGIQGGFGGGVSVINVVGPVNTYHGITPHQTADLVPASGEPPIAFALHEASFSMQWNDPSHLGRALLGIRTNGLAWSYAGPVRIEWQYPVMALGGTIGEAWRKTQNDAWMWPMVLASFGSGTGVKVYTGSRSQGGYTYAPLLGDPTLRQAPAFPPGPLTGTTNASGHIVLSWGASPDANARYHVYRSTEPPGGKWTRLTEKPLSATTWSDTAPPAGQRSYMVRSLVLKTTASGSFTNVSAGSIWP